MANKGVLSTTYKLIREYVFAAILQLQNKKESDTAHHQFGWTNKKSFVVGSESLLQMVERDMPHPR